MKTVYKWKIVGAEGLLMTPASVGPYHYNRLQDEYDTEEEAVVDYAVFVQNNKHEVPHELVLLKCFRWEELK